MYVSLFFSSFLSVALIKYERSAFLKSVIPGNRVPRAVYFSVNDRPFFVHRKVHLPKY